MSRAYTVIVCLLAGPAMAGTLEFRGPDVGSAPGFSIYAEDDPLGAPRALAQGGDSVDLPQGRYVFGVDAYPWRSAPYELGEGASTHSVELGAIRLGGVADTLGSFGIFDNSDGRLVAPILPGGSVFVAEGSYRLRRDLSDWFTDLDVAAGEVEFFELGAVQIEGAGLPPGQNAFLVNDAVPGIVAVISDSTTAIAMPKGEYLLASSPGVPPAKVRVEDGQTTAVAAAEIVWADAMQEPSDLRLAFGDSEIDLPGASREKWTVFQATSVVLVADGTTLGRFDLAQDVPNLIWRLADGRLPAINGLPLTLEQDGPQVLPRGATVRLRTAVAARVDVEITLLQGEAVHNLGAYRVRPENPVIQVLVPESLNEEQPAEFSVIVASNPPMEGRSAAFPIHRPLTQPVEGLEIMGVSSTSVELSWSSPASDVVKGVMVFRGDDERAINGASAVSIGGLVDIGLSAGSRYVYRICPVDLLGYLGPCVAIEAKTQSR